MKNYAFYIKTNPEEAITRKSFPNEHDAVIYFAKLKDLTIDQFLNLFVVY